MRDLRKEDPGRTRSEQTEEPALGSFKTDFEESSRGSRKPLAVDGQQGFLDVRLERQGDR